MFPVSTVGVDDMRHFDMPVYVFRRSFARLIGSPSSPIYGGYLSTSSRNRYRIGFDAREEALFAPHSARNIPQNCISSVVLRRSSHRSLTARQDRNMTSSRFLLIDSASATVG